MKPSLSQTAVMNVDKGEEIIGGWAAPRIPQVGLYKLPAKKKPDETFEWAHFIQRDNGLKEKVMRGTVKDREELNTVIETENKNLSKIFGVKIQATDYDMITLDGKKASGKKQ
jgi:hypothetical protein